MGKAAFNLIKHKDAEIERLKEGIKFERERVDNIPNLIKQAIKEFGEELKERVKSAWGKHFCVFPPPQNSDISQNYLKIEDFEEHINSLLKEMVGDK